jgi:hypothetical protein
METLTPTSAGRLRSSASPRRVAPVRHEGFDREYWLGHCEGYRVDTVGGRLGFVEEIRGGEEPGRRATLVIRAGRLGKRLLLVPAAEVDFIVPRAKRIWLRSTVSIIGSEAAA